jgi:CheY-like chemotaxis protein
VRRLDETRRIAMTTDTPNAGTVLVVDDEPALCKAIRMILELEGYRVATATSGEAALASAISEVPALVLLDLHMPGMDGWQTQTALQAREPRLPIIFMTTGDRVWQEATDHRAAGALAKPFDVDGVLDAVARFVPSPAP